MARGSLLVSDVDGTLLGDDPALAELAAWYQTHADQLTLVYSSGRFFGSVLESVETTKLPAPRAIIGGVGTDIRLFPTGERIEQWPDTLGLQWDADLVRAKLANFPRLEDQPHHLQSEYKVSYYLRDAEPAELRELEDRLTEAGLSVSIIYSSQRDLDVLPGGANKGAAARFLAEYWDFDLDKVLVSGDSGNDEAMFQPDFRGIVVGNAHAELKSLRGPHIYHAQQEYAGGVLEGLRHWLKT